MTRRTEFDGWQLCRLPAGTCESPESLDGAWIDATVPGTLAQALGAAEPGQDVRARDDLDSQDVWYRCRFDCEPGAGPGVLHLEGLATLADVWLNGEQVLRSDNMFVTHQVDVGDRLQAHNELAICFRALGPVLGARKPRPRFKTRLVREQNLRWVRSTLLGYIPGWCPPTVAVGPWRPVFLQQGAQVLEQSLRTRVDGPRGVVHAAFEMAGTVRAATLRVGDEQAALQVTPTEGGVCLTGELWVPDVQRWHPHTAGEPHLYDVTLTLQTDDGDQQLACGQLGFRTVKVLGGAEETRFQLSVNGRPLFCRGACWTPQDVVGLGEDPEGLRHALTLARNAGINMLRVGGTMVYESDAFYRLCDELGILVWQDFMFANMDYPIDDEGFRASVLLEARQQLTRLAAHPSLAMLCGGSEVAQQAAMLGLEREAWLSALFSELLPTLGEELAPEVPYVPSTPWGGALPFRLDRGVGHYFGVGAYLRPLDDARTSAPRFAAECLAFSIPPEDATLNKLLSAGQAPGHDPVYKQRVPRDSGAGWDFQDVTDHYVEQLFGVNLRALRYENAERYMELSRVCVGEVMAQTFGRWRQSDSPCEGALLWFYRDLWEGSGWGIVDSTGLPKAPYYYFKRAWAPVAAWFTDEGLNGVQLWLHNETAQAVEGKLTVELLRESSVRVEQLELDVSLAAGEQRGMDLEQQLGRFMDAAHAYRFGPASCDLITARLQCPDAGDVEAFHFPLGPALPVQPQLALAATAQADQDDYVLTLAAEQFAQAVAISAKGYLPEDNYFHMAPGSERRIRLRPMGKPSRFSGRVKALNSSGSTRISVKK